MRDVDLNLLVVFDTVMTEHSLTRAAERLSTTQPAVSHALARLRAVHRDPLFVRSGRGIRPTPRALELYEQTHAALEQIRGVARPVRFDPRTLRRPLRVATPDLIVHLMWLPLRRMLDAEAPGVDLYAVPINSNNGAALLDSAMADLALTPFPLDSSDLQVEALLDIRFACMMRRGHPLARGDLDAASYAAADHMVVSTSSDPRSQVDAELARQGMTRRIALSVNSHGEIAALVAGTDLLATVPDGFLTTLREPHRFALRPVPLTLPIGSMRIAWHARNSRDPAHRWLRERIIRLAAEFQNGSTPAAARCK